MNERIIRTLVTLCAFFALLTSFTFAGGERSGIAGISMARTFVASGRGLEAVGTNPANLVLSHRGKWTDYVGGYMVDLSEDSMSFNSQKIRRNTPPSLTLSIIPFSMSVATDFVNYDIYKEYFTGIPDTNGDGERESRFLSDDDKEKILGIFPDGLAETHADLDLRLFGMTIHNDWLGEIAFTVTHRVSFNFDMPKDYLRFGFFGLDSNGSMYDFSGTDVRGWHLREYGVSYARRIPQIRFIEDFAAGITVKYFHGYNIVLTDKYDATFGNRRREDGSYELNGNFDFRVLRSTSNDIKEDSLEIKPFPSPAGTGVGFDLGVSGEIYRGVRAGLSIVDVGSITWTENTKETIAHSSFTMTNPTSEEQTDSLKNSFKGEDRETGEFSTSLATALRVGTAVQVDNLPFIGWFPGQMLLSIEYQQGFNDSPGNSKRPRVGVGAEWRPVSFFPLRTGVSIGGADRFNWAAGLGLDFGFFTLDLGSENVGVLFSPNSFNQASFGLGMTLRI